MPGIEPGTAVTSAMHDAPKSPRLLSYLSQPVQEEMEDTDRESKRQEKPYLQGRGLEIFEKPELGIEPGTSDPRHHRTTPTPPHFLESQVDKKLVCSWSILGRVSINSQERLLIKT